MGHRHSSVDSSAPSILPPQVWVPSTPSLLFSIYIVQIVHLSFELDCENDETKQKEAGIGLFKKQIIDREPNMSFYNGSLKGCHQCDQIFFINAWPFTTINICPIVLKKLYKECSYFVKFLIHPQKSAKEL